ncbi:MAG: aminotransferase class I/II-fold pyridoxal phosphate-dependent enzyme [Proteobacteria bacterium]|nr:aminotransferase class I/II-fold pyridoxal phosphate-dependent enzyme [Pseudomonadota bacterium]
MKLKPFQLERYFAKYEFFAKYLLCCSDCESLSMEELLALSDSETLNLWKNLKFGYTETSGHPLLREEISNIYKGISSDDVLVVTPEEGIFIALNTILEKGDHVICTFPGYQSLYEISESLGCDVTMWSPKEQDGWSFDVNDVRENIRSNTKLIIANFPHNPTGSMPSPAEFLDLINIAKDCGAYFFSDEMYRFLEIDTKFRLPSACEEYERAITLFGMSKTFGLPGLRIGWLVTRNREILEEICTFKDYTTICSSAPSEILSIIALRARNEIILKQIERLRRNLKALKEFFNHQSRFFSIEIPLGGSICFPRLLIEQSSLDFCENLVKEEGILLVPSTLFDYGDNHIRMGFGRENTPQAIDRFSSVLDRYK